MTTAGLLFAGAPAEVTQPPQLGELEEDEVGDKLPRMGCALQMLVGKWPLPLGL